MGEPGSCMGKGEAVDEWMNKGLGGREGGKRDE